MIKKQKNAIFTHKKSLSFGKGKTSNKLIHGDNLTTIDALREKYSNSIKCVYLDPPYNNGENYKHYFDSMSHEEWINLIRIKLEKIHPLLTNDGSLWISIDDSELHYLKVEADKIYGRQNFVSTIVWERRTTRENRKVFSRNHEYILVYSKDITKWKRTRNFLPITEEIKQRYKNPDSDPRGPWQSVSANVQEGHATPQQFYEIEGPNGKRHTPPKGRCWAYAKPKMLEEITHNNIWFGKSGNGAPRIKKFLKDRSQGLTPETLWKAADVGTTSTAKKHLLGIFKDISIFDTPKPEELIHRILHIGTNPGDTVLDPFLGSGTTAAVAHKMGRRYIGIELGEHIKTHCAERLHQVIKGESGGVSEKISWKGGGSFNFYTVTEKENNE